MNAIVLTCQQCGRELELHCCSTCGGRLKLDLDLALPGELVAAAANVMQMIDGVAEQGRALDVPRLRSSASYRSLALAVQALQEGLLVQCDAHYPAHTVRDAVPIGDA